MSKLFKCNEYYSYVYQIYWGEKMDRNQEWLIGGILCLIIAIILAIYSQRITAGTIVAVILCIYGFFRAFR